MGLAFGRWFDQQSPETFKDLRNFLLTYPPAHRPHTLRGMRFACAIRGTESLRRSLEIAIARWRDEQRAAEKAVARG